MCAPPNFFRISICPRRRRAADTRTHSRVFAAHVKIFFFFLTRGHRVRKVSERALWERTQPVAKLSAVANFVFFFVCLSRPARDSRRQRMSGGGGGGDGDDGGGGGGGGDDGSDGVNPLRPVAMRLMASDHSVLPCLLQVLETRQLKSNRTRSVGCRFRVRCRRRFRRPLPRRDFFFSCARR